MLLTMKQMSAEQFRVALKRLGFPESDVPNDVGLSAFARFLSVSPRAVRQWADTGPPAPVAILLRLMLAFKISAPRARKILED